MSNDLRISLNEFRALLRKAFEGIYGHSRDWNALADLILWLEYRGLKGLESLFAAAPSLKAEYKLTLELSSQLDLSVNAKGASLLSLCPEIGDLLIANAQTTGVCAMQINNVTDAELIAATVNRCGQSGMAAAAWWPGQDGSGAIAFQSKNEAEPNLYRIDLPSGFEEYSDVFIVVDQSLENIQGNHPDWFSYLEDGQTPSNEINNIYLSHLDNGYEISGNDYSRLCKLADRILVEATEQSRQGAGE